MSASERTLAKVPLQAPPAGAHVVRRTMAGNFAEQGGRVAHDAGRYHLQRKLLVGSACDPSEREADRIADRVLAMPLDAEVSPTTVQVSRSANASEYSEPAPPSVEHVLGKPGTSLDNETRRDMEHRFGHDFARVRLHVGSDAEESARHVRAHAYTVGHHIVFGSGRLNPASVEGRRLLAHELTHVLQQSTGMPSNHYGSQPSMSEPLLGQGFSRGLNPIVAREPAPEPSPSDERLLAIEKQLATQRREMRSIRRDQAYQEAVAQKRRDISVELEFSAYEFELLFLDWENAILRIDFGFTEALKGFKAAHLAQEAADELRVQLLLAAAAVGIAFAFEPLFVAAVGKLGASVAAKLESIAKAAGSEGATELLENPAIEAVGALGNLHGAYTDLPTSEAVPTISPDLSNQLAGAPEMQLQLQVLNQWRADASRLFLDLKTTALSRTDSDIDRLDLDELSGRSEVDRSLAELRAICRGASEMKTDEEVARIIERHLWALWIKQQNFESRQVFSEMPNHIRTVTTPSLGTYVADRLMYIGVGEKAGVKLGNYFYLDHEPDNWGDLLMQWATGYRENLLGEKS